MSNSDREDEEALLGLNERPLSRKKPSSGVDMKLVAFFSIGFISAIYVVAELGAALYMGSLVLMSDGFHNLSDVISLAIAYWARLATKRASSDDMTYGWARTELIGGLTNGCFLLSLVIYVMLESIPKFIDPIEITEPLLLSIVAGAGLAVNLTGTIVFAITGQGHSHSHSHGGHSHGHGHSEEKDKKKKKKKQPKLAFNDLEMDSASEVESPAAARMSTNLIQIDDSNGHDTTPKKEKKKEGHSHGHKEEGHSHGHSHEHKDGVKKEKKEKKEGHSHGHKEEGHSHEHTDAEIKIKKEKKEKKEGHSHGHKEEGHSHGHKEGKKEGHSHGHKEGKKAGRDENVHAVFLHFLGDAISSLLVLGAGLLIYFFKGGKWTAYVDPVSSLVISCLILYTTVPLIKRCSMILLQNSGEVPVNQIRKKLAKVEGLLSIHDLHIWQLVDGMTIASVHIAIEEGVDFNTIVNQVKKTFHKFGVHSTSIQPEFVPRNFQTGAFCVQNCVKECDEDWCCKKSVENLKALEDQYSIRAEM